MSDIVRDLYEQQAHYETEPEYEHLCEVLDDGAKEIERLRAALRAIRDLDGNPYEQDHVHLAKEALGDNE